MKINIKLLNLSQRVENFNVQRPKGVHVLYSANAIWPKALRSAANET